MDYDRNIHHNPDAMAWAKFFVVSTKDMGREVFCDEGYMVGWFANAMMAMHDSMKPHEAADEIERLREALKECSADFVTKSSNHRVAAQEILNEFERRALLARAALKWKE